MEVRAGYKQTEVGVIPEEWDARTLASLGSFSKGQGIRKNEASSGNLPCVRYGEIYTHHSDIVRDYNSFISAEVAQTSRKLSKGDILFAGSGETKEEIGKAVAYLGEDEAYAGGDIVILSPRSESSEFLGYLLNSPIVTRQKASKGQGDAVVHISASALGVVVIPLPPLPEQHAIAAALSDVDALLDGLERLIVKKRDIKQAAMQQLLIGQTRLPGFNGEWDVKRLGETAILKARIGWQGLTTAEYLNDGDYYLVTGTEFKNGYVEWSSCHYVDESRYKQDKYIQLKVHDVLVTKDGTIGKVALVRELPRPATLNSGVFVIRPMENAFHPEFFYYLLSSISFREFLAQLSAGSTINHLYQKDFVSFKYKIPASIAEQSAIATILSDMDEELSVLEARLDKTRALKQAMIQELLTGRTRLI